MNIKKARRAAQPSPIPRTPGWSKRSICKAEGFFRNGGVLQARRSEGKGPTTQSDGPFSPAGA
ncbi:MAG: hypothetical protein ACXVCR_09940 [Bdellovibrio sp.]